MHTRIVFGLTALLFLTSCSRPKPIVVGSKDSLEQQLLGEIIAQHLEHKMQTPVQRRFAAGDTRTVHQSMLDGGISLYAEYSGLIMSEVLRETPGPQASVVFERSRQEMKRIELVELLPPLGFNSPTALVIRAEGNEQITRATEAAASPTRWKVGVSYEFQNRPTGLPSLNTYRLEMGAPLRSMDADDLFKALEAKDPVTLVTASLSDGHLTLPKWKALEDDQHAFAPAEAAILVRDDVLTAEPNLRAALMQLSGKISLETMRKLNAEVVLKERKMADVAAEFLKSAGLN
ncbi:MAG: glycine betaine ABC transporter substrate-binding protein [Bryobacteraceae bacterium]